MPSDPDSLKVANDSGFPLQIAVARKVSETSKSHGWTVRYTEHSWANRQEPQSGFLDLVLQNHSKTIFLVIECKRVRNSTWLFLHSDGETKSRRHAKAWVSLYKSGHMPHYGWADIAVDPPSPEAQFCAIRGQSAASDRVTLLERIGGDLLSSVEALAAEERDYRAEGAHMKIYLNAIVTTADLKTAKFDPSKVSLADGTLADADFEDVPFVRLRKQLSTKRFAFTPNDYRNSLDIGAMKEQTVFIVRADALPGLLANLEVDEAMVWRLGDV